MRIKILIVDDEEPICEILKYNLELEGYEADYALSAEEAMNLDLSSYALFILDIMMDQVSGFDFAKQLRNNIKTENTPIIFCSAPRRRGRYRDGAQYRWRRLYHKAFCNQRGALPVCVPCCAARRPHSNMPTTYPRPLPSLISCSRPCASTATKRHVTSTDSRWHFTKTEFEILLFFLTHRNRIYSREEIIREVWPDDVVVSNRTIDTNITRLRKKIDPYGNYIITRLGFGYGFKETI